MEQNLPIISRKGWNIVRTILFLLRKGISKAKLMSELNMMIKPGKIAGKAIQNLMFHFHHHRSTATAFADRCSYDPPKEYEFSCSNSPAFRFHIKKRKTNYNHAHLFSSAAHPPPPPPPAMMEEEEDIVTMTAVMRTLEMLQSASTSPALPGFGKSPRVKQLRITDSPFPLRDVDEDNYKENCVDEAGEKFIMKFYSDLRKQNATRST